MFAGTGAGGSAFPFVISALLHRFGYKVDNDYYRVRVLLPLGEFDLNPIKRRVPIGRVTVPGSPRRPKLDSKLMFDLSMLMGMSMIL